MFGCSLPIQAQAALGDSDRLSFEIFYSSPDLIQI